jgi:hypothetical protein
LFLDLLVILLLLLGHKNKGISVNLITPKQPIYARYNQTNYPCTPGQSNALQGLDAGGRLPDDTKQP